MAVPPRPGSDIHPTFEADLHDEPAPRVPKPLPDEGRSWTPAIVLVVLTLVAIALIVLL